MTEEHGKLICGWKYPAPYDIYNWPSWEQMKRHEEEFADPRIRSSQYHAVIDASGELCGFAQLFPMLGVTRLGLGMKPDRCGRRQGAGTAFVKAIVQEARRLKSDDEIDLEVLTWNERAIRTYAKAGFEPTDSYEKMTPKGMSAFYCMVYRD
ncbi:GNAT family N-acetyltransferase [Paenibacillus thalictri]|uniref:GNAT family N-acetyltransferase n=1 Tax=Paenibacillus thalictri TaxID=2527873 RepID=A0A4Q9DJ39_9BACL|nr:GNAT family N-acetyltransferase [Paenibacillus thalictri]TBL72745.1 GNAT family N-acetyltransferase [Paenibacillus thalictri]